MTASFAFGSGYIASAPIAALRTLGEWCAA
jgi:hypothetical protein